MPSPVRRSARGAQPTASSTTSSHSSRQDRGTRAIQTQKSGTPRSLSSEEVSEPPVARRSQRQPATQKEDSSRPEPADDNDNDEEAGGDDEITRCICGFMEYPGLPTSDAFKHVPITQLEEVGGLFISCDGCDTWQHGGCVGILEESQVPEQYFCYVCQPKLHARRVDSKGQEHSLYLPLHPNAKPTRKASISKHDEKAKKEREAAAMRASVDPHTGKRRGTMRSKVNDEELEQLKRAIEESKRDGDGATDGGKRNGKRGRDDSSEDSNKQDNKRQRRASGSGTSAVKDDDSDDVGNTTISKAKKAKADAVMSARQAEQDKKDKEREKARSEAAGRRQERARSRRNDEADANEESTPKPNGSDNASPPAPSSQPPTPPPAEKAPAKRGPGKKPGKKLGNNQYTKNRFEQSTSSPHGRKRQLQNASGSGDDASEAAVNGESNSGNNGVGKNSPGVTAPAENGTGTGKGKFGRGKKNLANGNGTKGQPEEIERTFTNMQAVLKNMSAYVTKEQDELAAANGVGRDKSPLSAEDPTLLAVGGAVQAPTSAASVASTDERRFEDLSSAEMAVQLQKGIENWQRTWGHLAAA